MWNWKITDAVRHGLPELIIPKGSWPDKAGLVKKTKKGYLGINQHGVKAYFYAMHYSDPKGAAEEWAHGTHMSMKDLQKYTGHGTGHQKGHGQQKKQKKPSPYHTLPSPTPQEPEGLDAFNNFTKKHGLKWDDVLKASSAEQQKDFFDKLLTPNKSGYEAYYTSLMYAGDMMSTKAKEIADKDFKYGSSHFAVKALQDAKHTGDPLADFMNKNGDNWQNKLKELPLSDVTTLMLSLRKKNLKPSYSQALAALTNLDPHKVKALALHDFANNDNEALAAIKKAKELTPSSSSYLSKKYGDNWPETVIDLPSEEQDELLKDLIGSDALATAAMLIQQTTGLGWEKAYSIVKLDKEDGTVKNSHYALQNAKFKSKGEKPTNPPVENLSDPSGVAEFPTPGDGPISKEHDYTGHMLNGIPFTTAEPKDWDTLPDKPFAEPEMPVVSGKKPAAGVLIQEPDGRVWLFEPKGHFAGVEHSYPKGKQEEGLTLQQTAQKEAFEEAGLNVELMGYLGDYEKTTSVTRYYLAKRTGGHPGAAHWETQGVKLVPPDQLENFVNIPIDQDIANDLRNHPGFIGQKQSLEPYGPEDLPWQQEPEPEEPEEPIINFDKNMTNQELYDLAKDQDVLSQIRKSKENITGYLSIVFKRMTPKAAAFATYKLANVPGEPEKVSWDDAVKIYTAVEDTPNATFDNFLDVLKIATGIGIDDMVQGGKKEKFLKPSHSPPPSIATTDDGQEVIDSVNWESQLGSNKGGIYTSPDGTRYYIKKPQKALQAYNEAAAASLYKQLGVSAPHVNIVKDNTGHPHVASRWMFDISKKVSVANVAKQYSDVLKDTPKSAVAQDVMEELGMVYMVSALLKNWDVAGLEQDNLLYNKAGNMTVIDSGGSLLFRAQGDSKEYGSDPTELNTFLDSSVNKNTAALFTPMYANAGSTAASFSPRNIARLEGLRQEDVLSTFQQAGFSELAAATLTNTLMQRKSAIVQHAKKHHKLASNALNQQKSSEPSKPPKPKVKLSSAAKAENEKTKKPGIYGDHLAHIQSGFDSLHDYEMWYMKQTPLKKPAPTIHGSSKMAQNESITEYGGYGYKDLNSSLRESKSMDIDQSAKDGEIDQHSLKYIRGLDDYIASRATPTDQDIVIYRGSTSKLNPIWELNVGGVFRDFGFVSTSISSAKAREFKSSEGTMMEIELPKGSRAIFMNASGAEHNHKEEKEVLLPRGSRFEILGFKGSGYDRVVRVRYIIPGSTLDIDDDVEIEEPYSMGKALKL